MSERACRFSADGRCPTPRSENPPADDGRSHSSQRGSLIASFGFGVKNSMILMAAFDLVQTLTHAITVAAVGAVFALILRSAQAETAATFGQRTIQYPKLLKRSVAVLWLSTGVLAVAADFAPKGDAMMIVCALGLFFLMLVPLYLETFWVRITWDDSFIYAKSPWRRSRVIPFSAVRSCDYSTGMQWYRIRTEGFGIIRLHNLAKGIPELLAELPCDCPEYPPPSIW